MGRMQPIRRSLDSVVDILQSTRCTLHILPAGGLLNRAPEPMEEILSSSLKMLEAKRGLRPLWQNNAEPPDPEQ
jgi:hypothetical protein